MTNDNNTVLNTVVKKTLPIKKIREDKIIPKKKHSHSFSCSSFEFRTKNWIWLDCFNQPWD